MQNQSQWKDTTFKTSHHDSHTHPSPLTVSFSSSAGERYKRIMGEANLQTKKHRVRCDLQTPVGSLLIVVVSSHTESQLEVKNRSPVSVVVVTYPPLRLTEYSRTLLCFRMFLGTKWVERLKRAGLTVSHHVAEHLHAYMSGIQRWSNT